MGITAGTWKGATMQKCRAVQFTGIIQGWACFSGLAEKVRSLSFCLLPNSELQKTDIRRSVFSSDINTEAGRSTLRDLNCQRGPLVARVLNTSTETEPQGWVLWIRKQQTKQVNKKTPKHPTKLFKVILRILSIYLITSSTGCGFVYIPSLRVQ